MLVVLLTEAHGRKGAVYIDELKCKRWAVSSYSEKAERIFKHQIFKKNGVVFHEDHGIAESWQRAEDRTFQKRLWSVNESTRLIHICCYEAFGGIIFIKIRFTKQFQDKVIVNFYFWILVKLKLSVCENSQTSGWWKAIQRIRPFFMDSVRY